MTQASSAARQSPLIAILSTQAVSCKTHRIKLCDTLSMLQNCITAKKPAAQNCEVLMGL